VLVFAAQGARLPDESVVSYKPSDEFVGPGARM